MELNSGNENDKIQNMFKRIMFTLLAFLMVYNVILIGYRIYEPEEDNSAIEAEGSIEYASLKDYLLNQGGNSPHYLFFYSSINPDCIFVKDTVLNTVSTDTQLQMDRIIETVDITQMEENMETKQIASEWGISSYPAFVAVHIKKGKIVKDNELVWNPDLPFTAMDIEQWLSLNGLYNFDVQPTGQEGEQ